jgi:ethanolaminephosphotransferase
MNKISPPSADKVPPPSANKASPSPVSPASAKKLHTTTYIPLEGFHNLITYQYSGEDKSLIFKHVLTPMNKVLVEFFPTWLAPNTITVSGLLSVMISHMVMWYYTPSLEGHAPTWVYIFNGFMLWVYQTLDNLDGRQARRVGASSPLGLFFDHGCDALNCTIGSLTLMGATQMGSTWKSLTLLMTTIFAFYLNTWEEYYTGTLILPVVNGPTEGLLLGIGFHLWTAYAGPDWWLRSLFIPMPRQTTQAVSDWLMESFGFNLWFAEEVSSTGTIAVAHNGILAMVCAFLCVVTLINHTTNVYKAVTTSGPKGHGKYTETWLVRKFPFTHACTRLIPFFAFTTLAVAWILMSPTDILTRYPRLMFWTIGLLFAKLVTHLMIAHLCAVEYHPFRRTLVPIFFFPLHTTLTWLLQQGEVELNEDVVVVEFFLIAMAAYVHLVFGCIQEFKAVLGIHCFYISKQKQVK